MSHRIDGTYIVKFQSNLGVFGAGVVTVEDLKVTGGDSSFLFEGEFQDAKGQYEGRVNVRQHSHGNISIFGRLSEFDLLLKGSLSKAGGSFAGIVDGSPQMRLTVVLEAQQKRAA